MVCNSASACIGLLAVVILSGLDGDNPLPCGRYEPTGRAAHSQYSQLSWTIVESSRQSLGGSSGACCRAEFEEGLPTIKTSVSGTWSVCR